jgi:hypothetical protein
MVHFSKNSEENLMGKISIQFLDWPGCGWYVRRESADPQKPDYLHNDGQWRPSTVQMIDGKKCFTGYFPTEAKARDASRAFL